MSIAEPQTAAPMPSIRRYRVTPDRLIVVLLVVEALLWLSERFGWLAWHKGYAVLTAVAMVGVALLLLFLWFAASMLSQWYFAFSIRTLLLIVFGLLVLEALLRIGPCRLFDVNSQSGQIIQVIIGLALLATPYCFAAVRLTRWRFQFSIRSLLVLVVVVAVPCSWMTVEMKKAEGQRVAVEVIEELDGEVGMDYMQVASGNAQPPGPSWLRNLFGEDFFMDVVNIDVDGPEVTDAMLERLAGLPQLQRMYFRGTRITDAGIEHLVGLSRLEEITLSDSQVTDAGVAKLQKALPNCKIIR